MKTPSVAKNLKIKAETMKQNEIKPEPSPTQPAAMIILISMVSFGLLSRLVLPALGMSDLFRMGFWVVWVLATAYYLLQTGNKRIARTYLLVMFGIVVFIGLAIYFYNR